MGDINLKVIEISADVMALQTSEIKKLKEHLEVSQNAVKEARVLINILFKELLNYGHTDYNLEKCISDWLEKNTGE